MNPLGVRTRSQDELGAFRKPYCHNEAPVASFLDGQENPPTKTREREPARGLGVPQCRLIYIKKDCSGEYFLFKARCGEKRHRADLCRRHYRQFRKLAIKCLRCGSLALKQQQCRVCSDRARVGCTAPACHEHVLASKALGYCMRHYRAHKRKGLPMPPKSNRGCLTAAAVMEFIESGARVPEYDLEWAGDDSEVAEEAATAKRARAGEESDDADGLQVPSKRRRGTSVDVEELRKFMTRPQYAVPLTGVG